MDRTRFKDAPWLPQKEESCFIGGCGGIGSWLSFFLARAGFSITIQDFDIVEGTNIAGQLFSIEDVGLPKVVAVNNLLKKYSGENINAFQKKVDEKTMSHYFMFSAFDNMKARKDMFKVWKKSISKCPVTPIFIDGRLETEQLQIFCVTPENIEKYEKTLFDDLEVADLSCSFKQTSHCAAMIASLMMSFFTNHITNIYERDKVRTVPFYYECFIPLVLINIDYE